MDSEFELRVTFKGNELTFAAQLVQFGYSYRIEVDVAGTVVSFERDDEGNWRALVQPEGIERNKISKELLQGIIVSLDTCFNS